MSAPDVYRPAFFDPLSTEHLTWIICRQFEEQPPVRLDTVMPSFEGPGLYAIYYEGDSCDLYRPLSGLTIPLYVGQSRSTNSATGRTNPSTRPLHSRVHQHRRSIIEGGLPPEEFSVRLLAMPDVHIDLGENGLRVGYQPVWNSVLNGFGSHEQGSTTRRSSRSKWDTVHEGRSRTYGAAKHDRDELIARATEAIRQQVERYNELPWHRTALE
ncbi:Eco29kI family restriction endonuclease [Saccharomonospora xinjiangensis]|uniref:Eco29kI restriction endonuclease n=1 Tax=Saccharomonospora xinjiangensis XJ-54 TaxID=882086 RepID=I0V2E4_9PSEU|nr:Eco29kI family restriction endonuclease [Saccharomonospora xinjiangensis]EID54297.1 Eco29kI restriction endonuclease [Saccharomonospora xinjiangensis XJ-54]